MAAHLPPVPPEQRSKKGPQEDRAEVTADPKGEAARKKTLDEKADRYGAVKQNTTNQGYQQDR